MLPCPPPQSLRICHRRSLHGQRMAGRPRVQAKGRLSDPIPGLFFEMWLFGTKVSLDNAGSTWLDGY